MRGGGGDRKEAAGVGVELDRLVVLGQTVRDGCFQQRPKGGTRSEPGGSLGKIPGRVVSVLGGLEQEGSPGVQGRARGRELRGWGEVVGGQNEGPGAGGLTTPGFAALPKGPLATGGLSGTGT